MRWYRLVQTRKRNMTDYQYGYATCGTCMSRRLHLFVKGLLNVLIGSQRKLVFFFCL